MLSMTDVIPTVAELMDSSLAKYIPLAANDCRNSGTAEKLIVNYVHPLFLEAHSAASKLDYPSWKEATQGKFADEYLKAMEQEIATLEALGAWGRYLKNTSSRGMVINPTRELTIDAYPDADFAGMYGHEKPTDPACAKSHSGFVIVFAGVPVLQQSKLKTQTALSTMEAEVIALAACMRELIPIMDMVQPLAVAVVIPAGDVNMRVSVHEDNSGALVLAETLPPQFTPRSKYYATKTI